MNITYLIGNGFDVNIGIKSRYVDFYESYVKKHSDDEADVIKRFKAGINDYIKKTWYKGTQGAEMAHELSGVLSDYNRYRNLFTEDEKISIDSKYVEANKLFHSFFGENQGYIDQMLSSLNLADQDLQNKKIKVQGYLGKV